MGRTIHYKIPKINPISVKDFKAMEEVQEEYRQRFTWTCESLYLEKCSWYPRWPDWYADSALPKGKSVDEIYEYLQGLMNNGYSLSRLNREKYIWIENGGYLGKNYSASGFTKVRGDEWNAWLVLRFLTWLSSSYPSLQIKVVDEGDFILVGDIILQGGKPEVDHAEVERRIEYLERNNFKEVIEKIRTALDLASQGIFYAEVPAKDYLDYREFGNLPIPREKAEKMSLAQISQCLKFPGEAVTEPAMACAMKA